MNIPNYIRDEIARERPEFMFFLIVTYPDGGSIMNAHKTRDTAERMGENSIANFPPGSTWKVIQRSDLQ